MRHYITSPRAQSQGTGKETDGDHRLPCTVTSLARRGPKKRRRTGGRGDIRLSTTVAVLRSDNAMMRWTSSARQVRSEDTLNLTSRHDPDVSVQRPVDTAINRLVALYTEK